MKEKTDKAMTEQTWLNNSNFLKTGTLYCLYYHMAPNLSKIMVKSWPILQI